MEVEVTELGSFFIFECLSVDSFEGAPAWSALPFVGIRLLGWASGGVRRRPGGSTEKLLLSPKSS